MLQNKIKYDPKIHHRRSIRLKGYDYSQAGAYFITICTKDRECLFGEIVNGEIILNDYGKIANDEWEKLPQRFLNFELDVFQVMPNHMHGIIVLNEFVGAGLAPAQNNNEAIAGRGVAPVQIDNEAIAGRGLAPAQNDNEAIAGRGLAPVQNDNDNRATARVAPTKTVGDIVGAYKSLVANECLKIFKLNGAGASPAPTMGKLWQRNYHEHIIRNEQSYQTISNYIINNPANWASDKFFIE